MNFYKKICKEFSFLKKLGYKQEVFFAQGCEVNFIGEENTILIICSVGRDEQYRKKAFLNVIVSSQKNRVNLLQCNCFDSLALEVLQRSLEGKKMNEQIEIYARFLSDNFDKLSNYSQFAQ